MLLEPVLRSPAFDPTATLEFPEELFEPAAKPTAVFRLPLVEV